MPYKLLYITNQISGPGGLERVLSIKASFFVESMGYEVHILTLNQTKTNLFYQFSNKIKYHNITVTGNPIKYLRGYISGIKETIKRIQPNIILVCDDGLKGLFLPLLLKKPCPMVYERHVSKNVELQNENASFFIKIATKIKFRLMDFGASKYNRFIVLTNGNLNEWNTNNIQVIPNPLSFYPDIEETSSLSNKIVLAVGKQSFQKGYDRLLKSWVKVAEKYPDWKLHIFGTIVEKEGLDELANALNISSQVEFYPPKKDIGKEYQKASIYAMSSRYEGFGMVLTEAMSYGVPCVAFDCPYGPSDIITHTVDGLLVENDNILGLSQAIISLIDDDDKRKKMGVQARISVERYNINSIALQWDSLFKALLKNN